MLIQNQNCIDIQLRELVYWNKFPLWVYEPVKMFNFLLAALAKMTQDITMTRERNRTEKDQEEVLAKEEYKIRTLS